MLPFGIRAAGSLPAFPGAEGFGSTTTHGRGGKVIEVTNLDDSGSGSLRAALEATGPRIVVFRVGGLIALKSNLSVKPRCMIAGQTAPGDGICIGNGWTFRIENTHDVVVRFLRFRPGDGPGVKPSERRGIIVGYNHAHNIVIDHCSLSWAPDENGTTYGFKNANIHDITWQWCIFSEGLANSIHPKGWHSCGLIIGEYVKGVSVHHNLFAHNGHRNPLMKYNTSVDIVNNVVYNWSPKWGNWAIGFSNHKNRKLPSFANIVGNYMKRKGTPGGINLSRLNPGSRIYRKDNYNPVGGHLKEDKGPRAVDAPPVTTLPAMKAYDAVLAHAGAVLPKRDVVDSRVVNDVRKDKGSVINSPKDVGGYPPYESGEPPTDSDRDGMPDEWEDAHGLDRSDPTDGRQDRNGDGYSNVEEYLNSLVPAITLSTEGQHTRKRAAATACCAPWRLAAYVGTREDYLPDGPLENGTECPH